jgi:hypothetical protein
MIDIFETELDSRNDKSQALFVVVLMPNGLRCYAATGVYWNAAPPAVGSLEV